ncbi:MAG: HAMP domain-containing histidine kinase [Proteobacteria bacterium]|nr:HAMP domain-containing histidine kinase [Pseudomonadota bacterium]
METHFASPERASYDDLEKDILHISHNPVIDSLLNAVSGLVAILNAHRQIISLNIEFLSLMGIENPESVLGLRPGEYVNCVHAHDMPGGCGTSEFCATCGAAISIVSSLETDTPVERKCVLTILKNEKTEELFLNVRACPIYIDQKRFLLLFLNDISKEQQSANIERLFFHDINNIVYAIQGRAELLSFDKQEDKLSNDIFKLSRRLAREIDIQRCLFQNKLGSYTPDRREISVKNLMEEMKDIFNNHPSAKQRGLELPEFDSDIAVHTDYSLLTRILINMLANAFEASEKGSLIKLKVDKDDKSITFSVTNPSFIPATVARRIFQRNFSTKSSVGRGLGTYAMKFFGEEILGGKVDFSSSPDHGTRFWISLPL